MRLTRSQWALVLTAACAECSCGGTGSIVRTERTGRGAKQREKKCPGCRPLRLLLGAIGIRNETVEPNRSVLA